MDYHTILNFVTIKLANRCSHATEEVNSRDLEGPCVIGTDNIFETAVFRDLAGRLESMFFFFTTIIFMEFQGEHAREQFNVNNMRWKQRSLIAKCFAFLSSTERNTSKDFLSI